MPVTKRGELIKKITWKHNGNIRENTKFNTFSTPLILFVCYSFFIILNGSVGILINTTFGSDDDQPDAKNDNGKNNNSEDCSEEKKNEDGTLDRSIYGNFVGKIGKDAIVNKLGLTIVKNTDIYLSLQSQLRLTRPTFL